MSDHTTSSPSPVPLPPVRTAADLDALWRDLMGQLGFAAPQLWVLVLQDARVVLPVKLDELPVHPSPDAAERLEELMATIERIQPDSECAFLFARPGGAVRTAADLAWARLCAVHSPWPVHLANDRELRVVSGDDLAGPLGRSA